MPSSRHEQIPDQGSNSCLLCLPPLAAGFFATRTTWEALDICIHCQRIFTTELTHPSPNVFILFPSFFPLFFHLFFSIGGNTNSTFNRYWLHNKYYQLQSVCVYQTLRPYLSFHRVVPFGQPVSKFTPLRLLQPSVYYPIHCFYELTFLFVHLSFHI